MKKAIVVASFGTTHPAALANSIEKTEERIRCEFPEFEVRRAFTSRTVIRRLAEQQGLRVDTEREALDKLAAEGYRKVYIQPLHVVPGAEYDKLRALVVERAHAPEKPFDTLRLSRPLLYYMGQEDAPDDYASAIEALKTQLPTPTCSQEAVLLMGHGGLHPANAAYGALQLKLEEAGLERVFVYTVEGFPSFGSVLSKLQRLNIRKVTLMPFLLVAGDHVMNDMTGSDEDSAMSQLCRAGLDVEVHLGGLGENAAIQALYLQHLQETIERAAAHSAHKR